MADPSASPQAQASPSPTSIKLPGGINIPIPPTGSGTTPDLYGLGQWRDQPIDLSGFPSQIVKALSNAGINTSQPMKASDLAAALASLHDTNAVQQIQQMLYYSGFYTSGTTLADLQLGRFGDKDVAALKNSIITAGQTSQQLGTYLTVGANTGYAQGKIDQAAGVGVTPITAPNPANEDYALRSAGHSILGREPSPNDLAGFRSWYDQAFMAGQKQAQKDAAAAQAQQLPDASTLGGALGRQGQGFSDAAGPPPQNLMLPAGMPASQGRNPDFTGPNPAYPAFQQQQQQDQALIGQFNQAGTANNTSPTITQAPDINAAAEQYLREHDAGDMQTQNALSAYGQILKFIAGNGSIG